ncbi:uncharacterized protein LOC113750523 [Coffea eugenioides]|uniref:uncharacterized protein LOC113750523 n=1 Tax=Coffea eugenioides TaxID=49369 RepID=UPI000F610F25|nr:uncharacterized protein LOC113750523 [Coffea eugenioides]
MELTGIILWNFWNNRNGTIFYVAYKDSLNIVSLSISYLQQFHDAHLSILDPSPATRRSHSHQPQWIKPSNGYCKANFNGAIFPSNASSDIGVVIRDDQGLFIAGFTQKISRLMDPSVVESRAAKYAMKLLHRLNIQEVVLEEDSQSVIKLIENFEPDDSHSGILIEYVIFCLHNCLAGEVSWVPRNNNKVAHLLAKHALSISDYCMRIDSLPCFVISTLEADLV